MASRNRGERPPPSKLHPPPSLSLPSPAPARAATASLETCAGRLVPPAPVPAVAHPGAQLANACHHKETPMRLKRLFAEPGFGPCSPPAPFPDLRTLHRAGAPTSYTGRYGGLIPSRSCFVWGLDREPVRDGSSYSCQLGRTTAPFFGTGLWTTSCIASADRQ